jgi:FKBP-type peptidyl-prolyl cis-trans isomerase
MPDPDQLGYALGVNIGSMCKKQHVEVNPDSLANAIKDVVSNRPTRFGEAEAGRIIEQFQRAIRARMAAERDKMLSENKAKADAFMATNAKAPGMITLTNGIEYRVLSEGTGPTPKPTDNVTINYKASLADGTVLDHNDQFTTLVSNRANKYKCWTEILPVMKTGSKIQAFVPPELGYGPRPMANVAPNSVLVFDMELVSILPPHSPPPAPPVSTASSSPVVSGQIIKVPSAEELKKGAKIEVITNVPNSN